MSTPRQELDKWETKLRKAVTEGYLLLGELGYGQQELIEIGNLLANTVFYQLRNGRYTVDETLHWLRSQWPLTFALYLVLEGVTHYDSENLYWHGPKKRLGIQNNHTAPCGSLFLDILVKFNLPTFEQSGGFRYVTPILLHGGIPNEFLGQFFDFLYDYEVQPHQISLDAQTLLSVWRQEPEIHLSKLRRPVSRFLQYGGAVADDFVARCLELFYADTEDEAALLDLPERVLRAFWRWREERKVRVRQRPSREPLIRLQRPFLTLAPYTSGLTLFLPPQQIPTQQAPQSLVWSVSTDDDTATFPTIRQRIENGYQYSVAETVTVPPAKAYAVRLMADEKELQSWTLSGLGDLPLLVFTPFDDYEADALDEQERHHPGERWLLYPQETRLRVKEGDSRKIRDLPRLTGIWQNYALEVWQLAPGRLQLDGQDFVVIREQGRKRPYLDGGVQPLPAASHNEYPLYSGRPPKLVIHSTQPHRWRISIRAGGNAQPTGYRTFILKDLPFRREEDTLRLDLAHPKLLGNRPIGKFEITVRGPLGHHYTLGLRMVPHLHIEGQNQVYLENPNEEAQLTIQCDPTTFLGQSPPQDGVDLREATTSANLRTYSVTAVAHIQEITLQLRHKAGVTIPLTIPIHRLRWRLLTDPEINENRAEWHTRPYTFFPGGLGLNACIQVHLPQIAGRPPLHLGWQLLDTKGQPCRQFLPDPTRLHRLTTIPWPDLLTSWRERQEMLCWQLLIQAENETDLIKVNALFLTPELDLREMLYEWDEDERNVQLTLCWERRQPGRKQLHLWPLDRPWVTEPLSLLLPETAVTMAEWALSKDNLPDEAYLGEIITYNPWDSQPPRRPPNDQPNTIFIKPPGVSKHYARLLQKRDQGQADASELLALLTHQFYNGEKTAFYETNKMLADHCETISPIWLVRWAEITHELDVNAYKLMQYKLFLPSNIDRLASENVSPDLLDRLFRHLPGVFPEKIHLWALESGIRTSRQRCLRSLCRLSLDNEEKEQAFYTAIDHLIQDVANGSLLVSGAIGLLDKNRYPAAKCLAQDGSQDAAELLRELSYRNKLEPEWVWTGMTLDTDMGRLTINSLRERQSGTPRYCAHVSGDVYAAGRLLLQPNSISVRLDLTNKILRFEGNTPYLCHHCHSLFSDIASYQQHHKDAHPGEAPSRKRLKRDEKLAQICPLLNDEELTT